MFECQLRHATRSLPSGVARWTSRAVGSGWFHIAPGAYDDDGSGAVCPIVAAAIMAGVWADRGLLPGHAEWGDASGPSESVADFAAYFDLCAEELGTVEALDVVRDELGRAPRSAISEPGESWAA